MPTTDDIRSAIRHFLASRYAEKAEDLYKQLAKAQAKNDAPGIATAEEKIAALQRKYQPEIWLAEDAERFARQLKFGTHTSKGIHPDSQGDNINFRPEHALPDTLVGSQCLPHPKLDATGNAAALPLAAFFDIAVGEHTLRDLLLQDHPALRGAFADDAALSERYQSLFQSALRGDIAFPVTHERNKQILWPLGEDRYCTLIPLHPSALVHHVYQEIQFLRYDEQQTRLRRNRREQQGEALPHAEIAPLAYITLGGSKPQNISQLNSQQRGINYLLPSLPPQYERPAHPHLRKSSTSFFNNGLRYQCRMGMQTLREVVKAKQNNKDIRELREQALETITLQILLLSENIRETWPPGWSREYPRLCAEEKYWLDPHDAHEAPAEWIDDIPQRFALWLNQWLRDQFKSIADDFADSEYQEWRSVMRSAFKAAARRSKGQYA